MSEICPHVGRLGRDLKRNRRVWDQAKLALDELAKRVLGFLRRGGTRWVAVEGGQVGVVVLIEGARGRGGGGELGSMRAGWRRDGGELLTMRGGVPGGPMRAIGRARIFMREVDMLGG